MKKIPPTLDLTEKVVLAALTEFPELLRGVYRLLEICQRALRVGYFSKAEYHIFMGVYRDQTLAFRLSVSDCKAVKLPVPVHAVAPWFYLWYAFGVFAVERPPDADQLFQQILPMKREINRILAGVLMKHRANRGIVTLRDTSEVLQLQAHVIGRARGILGVSDPRQHSWVDLQTRAARRRRTFSAMSRLVAPVAPR